MAFGTRGGDDSPLRFIPPEQPSQEYLPPAIARIARDDVPERYLNAFYWAYALSTKFNSERLALQIPSFVESAYGFLDPENEKPGFGIIAYSNDPRFGNPSSLSSDAVRVDDYTFPLVLRYRRLIEHAPTSPVGGTATCYAYDNNTRQFGVLTAAHVFGPNPQIGQVVQLQNATVEQICAIGPRGLDAALYTVRKPGEGLGEIGLRLFAAPYEEVLINTLHGGVHTRISAIGDTRGVFDPALPCHFYTDTPGQSGDSGALIQGVEDGKALGLYRGEVQTAVKTREGFALSLAQIKQCMNLNLLEVF